MEIRRLIVSRCMGSFTRFLSYCFCFFLKVFGGHMSFFGATGTSVLDFWWSLPWVSKPEWVLPYSLFCGGECNVHSPRFTSGATLTNLLAAGVQLVTSPHACAEVGLSSDLNVQLHEQKTNALPLCQWPGFSVLLFVGGVIFCPVDVLPCNWFPCGTPSPHLVTTAQ